ncbi:hypothetical protein TrST_g8238 [Triparma strigata]|uniref:HIT domain-containing protein n=1 Tax=Triparma strigata TaxID=1606541 RepID=A0A9W6ZKM0_9STRA|nr:hypothetical protein TrST_g8238 [Triparma strigata]
MSSSLKAQSYSFGPFTIPPSTVFYETSLTFAFVNLRPIVPGHVLICPKRPSLLLKDLSSSEYSDLWATVRAVQAVVEESKGAGGSNVAVQDGPEAGQSVEHVHVHVLPRVGGDFERNDDIYEEIEGWGPWKNTNQPKIQVPDDADRSERTLEIMGEEAESYRSKF